MLNKLPRAMAHKLIDVCELLVLEAANLQAINGLLDRTKAGYLKHGLSSEPRNAYAHTQYQSVGIRQARF
jgi:hypothetical protein